MKIALINGLRFRDALRRLGHEVVSFGENPAHDHVLPISKQSMERVFALASFKPDLIIVELYGAESPMFRGLEDCPAPLCAYAVDAPLNMSWLRNHLRLYDHVFVDQKHSAAELTRAGVPAAWLPLSIDPALYPKTPPKGEDKEYDVAFVGRFTKFRHKREQLIRSLENRYPRHAIHVHGREGDPWLNESEMAQVFAKSKIVINENLFDGVTLRVFQALASGAMLLTEHVESGLPDLFTPGEHLDVFTPQTLFQQVERYYHDDETRERIAQAGRELVLAEHTHHERAQRLLSSISASKPRRRRNRADRYASAAAAYADLALRMPARAADLEQRAMELAGASLQGAAPIQGRSHMVLGQIHMRNGDLASALAHFQNAVERLPKDSAPLFAMGHVLLAMKRPELAGKALLRAVALFLNDAPPQELEKQLSAGIYDARTWLEMGRIFHAQGVLFSPGRPKISKGRFPEHAVDYYILSEKTAPSADVYKAMGECFWRLGAVDDAYACSLKLLEMAPGEAGALELAKKAQKAMYAVEDSPLISVAEKLQALKEKNAGNPKN